MKYCYFASILALAIQAACASNDGSTSTSNLTVAPIATPWKDRGRGHTNCLGTNLASSARSASPSHGGSPEDPRGELLRASCSRWAPMT